MVSWNLYAPDGTHLGTYESTHPYEARVWAALRWGMLVESVRARKVEL